MYIEKSERQSRLLAALYLAQEQYGWLGPEAIDQVASRLQISPGKVLSTASFYSMMNLQPVGTYLIQICEGLSCYLVGGAGPLLDYLSGQLAINPGETSADGHFTLEIVGCLAACGSAPAIRINDVLYENVDQKGLDVLITRMQLGDL